MIDFKWSAGKPSYKKKSDVDGNLTAYNSNRQLEIIRRLEPSDCVEILGILMNAIGTDKAEFERTVNDINSWNGKMMEGSIYKRAAHKALNSTIYRTVCYRLPATQFNPSQCKQINFSLHRNILSRMGINSKLPNAYRYAPTTMNGMGFMDTRLEQCILHIMEYIQNAGRTTLTGETLTAELELCHLHCGLSENLFDLDYNSYEFLLPESELKFLLRECHHYGILLVGDYTRPTQQRTNDFFLMDKLLESTFTKEEISKVNMCRLFLETLTVTDTTTGCGGGIDTDSYNGNRSGHRKSKFRWPRQRKPPASSWRLWKLAVDTVWSNFATHDESLGTWISDPQKAWSWYLDLATHALYQVIDGDGIMKYDELPHLQRRTRYYYTPFGERTERLPITAGPVIPVWSNNAYCCTEGQHIKRFMEYWIVWMQSLNNGSNIAFYRIMHST